MKGRTKKNRPGEQNRDGRTEQNKDTEVTRLIPFQYKGRGAKCQEQLKGEKP